MPGSKPFWTRESAIAALREYAERLGQTPSRRHVNSVLRGDDVPSTDTYVRLFGSMGKAQLAAGLVPNRRGDSKTARWSHDEALNALRDLARRIGRTPSVSELRKVARRGEVPTRHVLKRLFGSHETAVRAAGLAPNHQGNNGWLLSHCRKKGHPMYGQNLVVYVRRAGKNGPIIRRYRLCKLCTQDKRRREATAAGKSYTPRIARRVDPVVAIRHSPREMARFWGVA